MRVHHVKKARKHTAKALDKGVSIPKDTVTITKSDTIRTTFTRNDTIYTELRIVDTITLEPTVEIRTKRVDRWMTKYKFKEVKVENRAMIDSLKQLVKIERQKTKQTKAESKAWGFWDWFLLILCCIGSLAIGYVLNIILTLRNRIKL